MEYRVYERSLLESVHHAMMAGEPYAITDDLEEARRELEDIADFGLHGFIIGEDMQVIAAV